MPLFNNIYNINFRRLAVWNLPTEMRKTRTVQVVIAAMEAIRELYFDFLIFRQEQLYEIKIDGRTCKIRRALNDMFDAAERRIYITKGDYRHSPVLYYNWKNRPVYMYNQGNELNRVLYYQSEQGSTVSVNFYVHVPADIFFEKPRIQALVNKYNNISRTFEIVVI